MKSPNNVERVKHTNTDGEDLKLEKGWLSEQLRVIKDDFESRSGWLLERVKLDALRKTKVTDNP